MAYTKPVLARMSLTTESSGCCFFVNDAGEGFFVYNEGNNPPCAKIDVTTATPDPTRAVNCAANAAQQTAEAGARAPGTVSQNNVASVGDHSASVTPLQNTGLPGTEPIIFGVPVGVTGVHANVGPGGSATSAGVNTPGLHIYILGQQVV